MPLYLYIFKLSGQFLKDIFFFPFWWYSFGLFYFSLKIRNFIIRRARSLAIWVWLKNIFTPMFGQYDWQGYLISFFIRLVQIIFRTVIMILWIILASVIFCVWLILPVLVVYQILYQLNVF